MIDDAGRRRGVRLLALSVCALSLLVVAVSAYLRLDAAGMGCADWPACYGRVLAGDPAPLHYGFPRLLHRLAASSALLLTCLLVWRSLRPTPLVPAARYAVLLLLLMLALSALGFASADPRRALVGFLNIVGGLGLVSFSWRVAMAAGERAAGTATRHPLALRFGALALSVTVMLGAWIGATYAAIACDSLPACGWPTADAWQALNPLFRPRAAAQPGDAGGALLHLLHRGFAVIAVATLAAVALVRLKRSTAHAAGSRRGPVMLLILLGLVFGLGLAAVSSGLHLWLVVAHGLAAALLLAAVAGFLRR